MLKGMFIALIFFFIHKKEGKETTSKARSWKGNKKISLRNRVSKHEEEINDFVNRSRIVTFKKWYYEKSNEIEKLLAC